MFGSCSCCQALCRPDGSVEHLNIPQWWAGIRLPASLADCSSWRDLLVVARTASDAVVVRFSSFGLGQPVSHKEGYGSQETRHDQDEQLPVQHQVVTVEEGQGGHDGLQTQE